MTRALAAEPGAAPGLRMNHPSAARGRATPHEFRPPPAARFVRASRRRASRNTLSVPGAWGARTSGVRRKADDVNS